MVTEILNTGPRGFCGDPVVRTSPLNAGVVGSVLGLGAKITPASWPPIQNLKQKQYCNKFSKDFENNPYQKVLKKKKKVLVLFLLVCYYPVIHCCVTTLGGGDMLLKSISESTQPFSYTLFHLVLRQSYKANVREEMLSQSEGC